MNISNDDGPLISKEGNSLVVLTFTRVSAAGMGRNTLEQQEVVLRRWITDHFAEPAKWVVIT